MATDNSRPAEVPAARSDGMQPSTTLQAQGEKLPSRIIALSDPEGSLLRIDATTAPYVREYQSVEKFPQSFYPETGGAHTGMAHDLGTHGIQCSPDRPRPT